MDFEWKQRVIFTLVVVALPLIPSSPVLNHVSHLLDVDLGELPSCPVPVEERPIPDSFDARSAWPECASITWQIRDQGSCSSWAPAVSSVLSDRFCIASNATLQFHVSEMDLLSCAIDSDQVGFGCSGAHVPSIWKFLMKKGTVSGGLFGCRPCTLATCDHTGPSSCNTFPTEESLQCHGHCTNPLFRPQYEEDVKRIISACVLPKHNVQAIQREIMTNGPVLAVMNLFQDLYHYNTSHNGGVYENLRIKGDTLSHHAVRILGWGSSSSEETGQLDYWIVANSWNYWWGEGGFFKVLRSQDVPRLGAYITQAVSAPTPDLSSLVEGDADADSVSHTDYNFGLRSLPGSLSCPPDRCDSNANQHSDDHVWTLSHF